MNLSVGNCVVKAICVVQNSQWIISRQPWKVPDTWKRWTEATKRWTESMSRISQSRLFQKHNVDRMIDSNENLTDTGWLAMSLWLKDILERMGISSFYDEED